jgi:iron complex transport system permease protein
MAASVNRQAARIPRQLRVSLTLTLLSALLVIAVILSVGTGAVQIAPGQIVAILLEQVGITLEVPYSRQQAAVLLAIRLPRVLLGVLVGASLAVAGAAMQGLFRNPLADPGLLGVSSGAALAAAIVLIVGGPFIALVGLWLLPAAAFVGSLLATLFVYSLATIGGRTQITTMLLAGIALSALANAGVGFLTFLADDAQLRDLTFWTLGSLGGVTWRSLTVAAPFMLAALLFIPRFARALNLFLLGEGEARHLGIDVEMSKIALIFLTAFAVGAAVSVAGIIGFVGLVVPHLVRLAVGPDHRLLLPASALLGATLLLVTDLLSRTIVAPAELPIGILTSVVGGPFFLWLLLRFRRRGGMI